MPVPPRSLLDRFWAKVDDSAGPDGCWPWRGAVSRSRHGSTAYGYIQTGGRGTPLVRAHRFALVYVSGEEPAGLEACHAIRCTTPLCCNAPHGHLRWGTRAENEQDKGMRRRTNAALQRDGLSPDIAALLAEEDYDLGGDGVHAG